MNLELAATRSFLRRVLRTPEGRAHMLNLAVEAEEGDEAGVFDRLQEVIEDPQLKKVVRRHQEDEQRHAAMYRECLRRNGIDPGPVPDHLRLVRNIAHEAGGALRQGSEAGSAEATLRTPEDIMNTYALLLAIERRGVERFPMFAQAFRPYDAETADTFLAVTKDEERHIKYAEAIGRRFAPSEDAWQQAVRHHQRIEDRAFKRVGLANIAYCTERGLLSQSRLAQLASFAVRALRRPRAAPHA